ncbi:protein phosphatase CheZ [Fundidesulfovibrio soli]|uniref:protein phosphatase CheZ n=1 Tax=Fundidesulfovibrio soli TaxID=2922716 RepID=UPI001FAE7C51|nr:protein phosphatase CheZ [Fundidesulfovibrio soli]
MLDGAELDALAARLALALKPAIRDAARDAVREELAQRQQPEMTEEDFFQRLNQEIMGRLGDIYREISSFQSPPTPANGNHEHVAQAGELMAEASHRLDQVIQATEKATFEIIELVERNMHVPDEMIAILRQSQCDPASKDKAEALCAKLSNDMVAIMTCLSFQDLTGQRIKRVIDMLGKVRDMVADLYLSAGILVKAKEKEPDQPLEQLKKDAKAKVSQSEVDDLLAQLNL